MADLQQQIEQFQKKFHEALAQVATEEQLEKLRVAYLGRQGEITQLMALLKKLDIEAKRHFGPLLNALKSDSLAAMETRKNELLEKEMIQKKKSEHAFDVTAYKPHQLFGSLHPYTHLIQDIEDIFISMGYEIVEGPEVETEKNNFEALNIPENHPARDVFDTFWLLQPHMLLRTHTSSVQTHVMHRKKPPIAIVAPGRCFRHEATDASHDFMFMQCEGLFIDKNISLNNLLATAQAFLQAIFEKDLTIRTRPNYFPFVEPGIEIDISCPFCTDGCAVCKRTRWIEICGAGLVHPNVLKFNGIDPEEYSGFAFGFGLSRLAMLKFAINDIRLLHSGNIEFLKQF